MHSILRCALLAAVASLCVGAAVAGTVPADGTLHFDVLRDGDPIGAHVLRFAANGDELSVDAKTLIEVKVFGLVAYRYRREATETWKGDRLSALKTATDDDGDKMTVDAALDGGAFKIKTAKEAFEAPAGAFPSSFWNEDSLAAGALVDIERGKPTPVAVIKMGEEEIALTSGKVKARRYHVTGLSRDYDLWYMADGEWAKMAFESRGSYVEYVADPAK